MKEENNDINKESGSENIFDEFADSSGLVKEVEKLKKEKNKDLFFYIIKVWDVLQTIFWLWLFVVVILFWYTYIQKDNTITNNNLLDPFCPIFLWSIKYDTTYCSSITSLKTTNEKKLEDLKNNQTSNILEILEKLYRVQNFTKSKEVIFLTDKSDNKLQVLSVLEKFDDIKNEFNIEKDKISCNNIQIDSKKGILSMKCESFSQWYEKWLRWFDGTTDNLLKWTSLSQANSFLNYIEKTSKYFKIVDRQKMFKEESLLWTKTGFTSKTQFDLKLKYNLTK